MPLGQQSERELLSAQGVPVPWHHDLEDTESKSSASEMQMRRAARDAVFVGSP